MLMTIEANSRKWQSMLGLACRAGRAAIGREAVLDAIKRRKALVLIIADDASERTAKEFAVLGQKHGIPIIQRENKRSLGLCLGRDAVAIAAVTNKEMAKELRIIAEAVGQDKLCSGGDLHGEN